LAQGEVEETVCISRVPCMGSLKILAGVLQILLRVMDKAEIIMKKRGLNVCEKLKIYCLCLFQ
jgi:hypothetical protein